jgi:hypothetical protein
MALTVYSSVVAQSLNLDPVEVKKDWLSGILPRIKVLPADIWALNRHKKRVAPTVLQDNAIAIPSFTFALVNLGIEKLKR